MQLQDFASVFAAAPEPLRIRPIVLPLAGVSVWGVLGLYVFYPSPATLAPEIRTASADATVALRRGRPDAAELVRRLDRLVHQARIGARLRPHVPFDHDTADRLRARLAAVLTEAQRSPDRDLESELLAIATDARSLGRN